MERLSGNLVLRSELPNEKPIDQKLRPITDLRIEYKLRKMSPLRKPALTLSPLLELNLNIINQRLAKATSAKEKGLSLYEDLMDDSFDVADILGAATVSKALDLVDVSEEKKVLGLYSESAPIGLVRRSTILNADPNSSDGVIYSFRQLQEYKQSDPARFDRAKEFIIMQARMAQDMDGCGGVNERGSSTTNLLSSKTNNLSNFNSSLSGKDSHNHEANHKHCDKHGKDDCTECAE